MSPQVTSGNSSPRPLPGPGAQDLSADRSWATATQSCRVRHSTQWRTAAAAAPSGVRAVASRPLAKDLAPELRSCAVQGYADADSLAGSVKAKLYACSLHAADLPVELWARVLEHCLEPHQSLFYEEAELQMLIKV